MNRITIEELVLALRLGHFEKGQGALKSKQEGSDTFGYCCEGVACELAGVPEDGTSEPDEDGTVSVRFVGAGYSFAPSQLWEGMGVETSSDGTMIMVRLPAYYIDDFEGEIGSRVFSLYGGDWVDFALATLNDYHPRDEKNEFTFDQIADLIEWYYLSES